MHYIYRGTSGIYDTVISLNYKKTDVLIVAGLDLPVLYNIILLIVHKYNDQTDMLLTVNLYINWFNQEGIMQCKLCSNK